MDASSEHPQIEPDGEQERVERSPLQRLERHVLSRMFSGFFVLIPLIVTVLILQYVFDYLDGVVRGDGGLLSEVIDKTPLNFPGVGVVIALIIFYVIGALVATQSGRRIVDWPNVILTRIPVVKTIYGVAKQTTDALSSPMGHRFSRVVLLEWPRPGVKAMGFVTAHGHSPVDDSTYLVVYIPTVPNPTSGMMALVPEEDVTETDITVEDAMKMVFSGGIVLPDALRLRPRATLSSPPAD